MEATPVAPETAGTAAGSEPYTATIRRGGAMSLAPLFHPSPADWTVPETFPRTAHQLSSRGREGACQCWFPANRPPMPAGDTCRAAQQDKGRNDGPIPGRRRRLSRSAGSTPCDRPLRLSPAAGRRRQLRVPPSSSSRRLDLVEFSETPGFISCTPPAAPPQPPGPPRCRPTPLLHTTMVRDHLARGLYASQCERAFAGRSPRCHERGRRSQATQRVPVLCGSRPVA